MGKVETMYLIKPTTSLLIMIYQRINELVFVMTEFRLWWAKNICDHDQKMNPNIAVTRCFLHREVLVCKTLGDELKPVMDQVVKMVKFFKSRPLCSRMFQSYEKIWSKSYCVVTAH